MPTPYHNKLRILIDRYVHLVYKVTRQFPKEEIYGATSQLRRSSLSVALNYIEGFTRIRIAVNRNFLEIAYGSLQESKYLILFALDEKWIDKEQYKELEKLSEEIGAMLWGALKRKTDT